MKAVDMEMTKTKASIFTIAFSLSVLLAATAHADCPSKNIEGIWTWGGKDKYGVTIDAEKKTIKFVKAGACEGPKPLVCGPTAGFPFPKGADFGFYCADGGGKWNIYAWMGESEISLARFTSGTSVDRAPRPENEFSIKIK